MDGYVWTHLTANTGGENHFMIINGNANLIDSAILKPIRVVRSMSAAVFMRFWTRLGSSRSIALLMSLLTSCPNTWPQSQPIARALNEDFEEPRIK